MTCSRGCQEWTENIPKVDAPFAFLTARNPQSYKGYDGIPMRYCPWCAAPLIETTAVHV
jgi:hypothetical protein